MKDRFGVARCCCESFCEDCCNGNAPAEWDVEIELADASCTTCDEVLSGTFNVPRYTPDICRWYFTRQLPDWQEECIPGYATYGDYVTRQHVTIDVRCISETHYRISATVYLFRQYNTGVESYINAFLERQYVNTVNGRYQDLIFYEAEVPFDEFICNEQTSYELPFKQAHYARTAAYQVSIFWFGLNANVLWTGALPIPEQYDPVGNLFWNPICQPPANLILTSIP